jgi:hypothetical protein
MNVSRRDLVVAGAFAFGASSLLLGDSVGAQGGDEAAVATTTRTGALQVWQKQEGTWKLLARQGFRLPA